MGASKLFDGFTDFERQTILNRYFEVKPLKEGQDVFFKGDKPDKLYYLEEGTAEVVISQESRIPIATFEIFGEFGFIDANPRSARVRVTSFAHVASLSRDKFLQISSEHPNWSQQILINILKITIAKVRSSNELISKKDQEQAGAANSGGWLSKLFGSST